MDEIYALWCTASRAYLAEDPANDDEHAQFLLTDSACAATFYGSVADALQAIIDFGQSMPDGYEVVRFRTL